MFFFVSFWNVAQLSHDKLQNGVWNRCAFVKLSATGGMVPFWVSTNLPEKVPCDVGYIAAVVSQCLAIWGHYGQPASVTCENPSAHSSFKFGYKLSHHVMSKVLVLEAPERHVM